MRSIFSKILLFSAIITALFLINCSKDDPVAITGNLFGLVQESLTNSTVASAQVSLAGESTQTGITSETGNYEFSNIPAGSYYVTVSKAGYVSQTEAVTIIAGKSVSSNFLLDVNLPTAAPNSLEFTYDDLEATVELTNTQSEAMQFTTTTSKTWLKVAPSTGSIPVNNKTIITITADLTTLNVGTYEEKVVVNVSGSSLTIPITIKYELAPFISVTKPAKDEIYKMGEIMPITWNSNLDGNVKIELSRVNSIELTITPETRNEKGGNYSWDIPGLKADNYIMVITSKENNEISFTTEAFKLDTGLTVPNVTTGDLQYVFENKMSIEGSVDDLGALSNKVDQHGHVYSDLIEVPTIADISTKYGLINEPQTFTSNITELLPSTTYYVRAYATNAKGTGYGEVITVTTTAGAPIVTTDTIIDIEQNSAIVKGEVITSGGSTLTQRGIFYGTDIELNNDSDKKIDADTLIGTFFINLTGLIKGTTYYVQSYATNSSGYGYGEIKSFKTVGDLANVASVSIDSITGSKAFATGNILSEGGEVMTSYGFVYGTNENPTINDTKLEVGTTTLGEFDIALPNLTPSTTYYVRAYATNIIGTSYGENISFATTDGLPKVITSDLDSITGSKALAIGNIVSDGGEELTSYGFVYGTNENPDSDDVKLEVGIKTLGKFDIDITNLTPSTTYHIRAYATNIIGTSYGENISFTTTDGLPKVITSDIESIVKNGALLKGKIENNGGDELISYGFAISKDVNPTINESFYELGATIQGVFEKTATNLIADTKYYIKAYATNKNGTAYGGELSFTTLDGLPKVTTDGIANISNVSAKLSGSVETNGGDELTSYGFAYATTENPTKGDNFLKVGVSVQGDFDGILSGLKEETKYYIKAYATNENGSSYGTELTFTTLDGIAVVSTDAPTNITYKSALLTGNLETDGGDTLSSYGFVYSTSPGPDRTDDFIETGKTTKIGAFESSLSGLRADTKYYVKAYATNSHGTKYGSEKNFTTSQGIAPTVSTTEVSDISGTLATVKAKIDDEGGLDISSFGIQHSSNINNINNGTETVISSISEGVFQGQVTNLNQATTYYIRAFATNATGTGYGEILEFKTLGAPLVSLLAAQDVEYTKATLKATIDGDGGSNITGYKFLLKCATCGSYAERSSGISINSDEYTINLTNLDPGTQYSFKFNAVNDLGNTDTEVKTFTTLDGVYFETVAGDVNATNGYEFDGNPNQISSVAVGLWVDDDGTIYISDPASRAMRVQKWVPGATYGINILGGNGSSLDFGPHNIFKDKNGNWYVDDSGNNKLLKFAPGSTNGVTVYDHSQGNGNHIWPINMYVDDDENIYFGHNFAGEWHLKNLFFKIPYDKELKFWIDFIPSPTVLDFTYLWKIVPTKIDFNWPEGIANPVMGQWLVAWKIDNDFEYMYLAENVSNTKSKIWKFHIADETMSLYCYLDVGLTDFVMDDQGYPIAITHDITTVIRINPNNNSYETIAGVPGVNTYTQKTLYRPRKIFRTTNGDIYILDGNRVVKIIN